MVSVCAVRGNRVDSIVCATIYGRIEVLFQSGRVSLIGIHIAGVACEPAKWNLRISRFKDISGWATHKTHTKSEVHFPNRFQAFLATFCPCAADTIHELVMDPYYLASGFDRRNDDMSGLH